MATKYDDIIKLRGGKAAYDIAEEKKGEWVSFIPNEQFNNVLRTVIKSVRGNDIDNHKSFWINGTYGTGKSHAVAVVSHLLGDAVEDIRQWVDYEYKDVCHTPSSHLFTSRDEAFAHGQCLWTGSNDPSRRSCSCLAEGGD